MLKTASYNQAAMTESLPEDEPHKNRQELLNAGHAITLLDIIKIHQHVGSCTCKGRKDAMAMQPSVEMER